MLPSPGEGILRAGFYTCQYGRYIFLSYGSYDMRILLLLTDIFASCIIIKTCHSYTTFIFVLYLKDVVSSLPSSTVCRFLCYIGNKGANYIVWFNRFRYAWYIRTPNIMSNIIAYQTQDISRIIGYSSLLIYLLVVM